MLNGWHGPSEENGPGSTARFGADPDSIPGLLRSTEMLNQGQSVPVESIWSPNRPLLARIDVHWIDRSAVSVADRLLLGFGDHADEAAIDDVPTSCQGLDQIMEILGSGALLAGSVVYAHPPARSMVRLTDDAMHHHPLRHHRRPAGYISANRRSRSTADPESFITSALMQLQPPYQ